MSDKQELDAYLKYMRENLSYYLMQNHFSLATVKHALISKAIDLAAKTAPGISLAELKDQFRERFQGLSRRGVYLPPMLPGGFRLCHFVTLGGLEPWHVDMFESCLDALIATDRLRGFEQERLESAFTVFVADTLHELLVELSLTMARAGHRVDLWPYIEADFDTLGKEEYIPACPEHGRDRIIRLADGRLICDCTKEEHHVDLA